MSDIDWQAVQQDKELVAKILDMIQSESSAESFGVQAETDRRIYVLDWMGATLDHRRPGQPCRVWTGTVWVGGTILKLAKNGAIVSVQGVMVYASTQDIVSNLTEEEIRRLGLGGEEAGGQQARS